MYLMSGNNHLIGKKNKYRRRAKMMRIMVDANNKNQNWNSCREFRRGVHSLPE